MALSPDDLRLSEDEAELIIFLEKDCDAWLKRHPYSTFTEIQCSWLANVLEQKTFRLERVKAEIEAKYRGAGWREACLYRYEDGPFTLTLKAPEHRSW